MITAIEWLAFCCTQQLGARWKELFNNTPFLVRQVFKNNFKTPLGITTISAGLQGLPIWLYIMRHFASELNPLWFNIFTAISVYCIFGRAICMSVEVMTDLFRIIFISLKINFNFFNIESFGLFIKIYSSCF